MNSDEQAFGAQPLHPLAPSTKSNGKAGIDMKHAQRRIAVTGLFLLLAAGAGTAQATSDGSGKPMTRQKVEMDAGEFLRTHEWDATREAWGLKPGYEAPSGVRSRADVVAERDNFLRKHSWNGEKLAWEPLAAPRDLSTRSHEQERAEAVQFSKTHSYDETQGGWVETKAGGG
jgi:hypothetical protein